MIEINIKFQEEYKYLDKLCREIFSSAEGVSEYIRQMEMTSFYLRGHVPTWDFDYNQLKHLRWIRNQLAHEAGSLYTDLAEESDVAWLMDFYNRIINSCDPLAIVRRAAAELRSRTMAPAKKSEAPQEVEKAVSQNEAEQFVQTADSQTQVKKKKSIWAKWFDKIKGFFSN